MQNTTEDFEAGDRVVYRDSHTQKPEEGSVTSKNDHTVFVCYGLPGSTSQGTNPEDLEHVAGNPRKRRSA